MMTTNLKGFFEAVRRRKLDAQVTVPRVIEVVAETLIAHLRSTSSEFGTSPDPREGGTREHHPGGWGDITGLLEKSYDYEISKTSRGWRLRLSNSAEYAAELDARDGFFVLEGVDKTAREEVEKALKIALPDWRIRLT